MKKKIKSYIQTGILPYFLQLIVRFIYLTNRKKFHLPEKTNNEPLVVAFWHGELIMQPFNYHKFRPKGKVSALISEHKDGEAITKTVEYLGIHSIRGSSSKGGAKALLNAIREIREGHDIAITPDGPRGPRFSVADGIVAISQKTNTKIVALNSVATKYWQFNSWDKFVLPKPFGTITFYVSEPFSIEGLDMDSAKSLIKEKLLENCLK